MIRASRGRQDTGSILVMTALALTMLLGITALAVDAGFMFEYRHQMQSAADAAAWAGAREIKRSAGIAKADLDTFVRHETAANGFTNGANGVTVTINRGPESGAFLHNTSYVEVLISRSTPTFFMRLYNRSTTTVGARGVAGLGAGEGGCVYALGPSQSKAIQTSGSGTIDLSGCDVYDNSDRSSDAFFVGSGWTFTAKSINVVGGTSIAGVVTPAPTTGVDPVDDPFAGKTPPTIAACDAAHTDVDIGSGATTLYQGTYCGGMKISGTAIVTFSPGMYVLTDGAFVVKDTATVQNTSPTDSGVTFYFAGVSIKPSSFTNGTHIHLHATTTAGDEYRGMLFYDPRVKTSNSNVFDSDDQQISGVVYYPHQHVEWKGNGGAYTVLVSDTMKFTGGSSLHSDFTSIGGFLGAGEPSSAE
jgi:Flp pilus assembly protein TadG